MIDFQVLASLKRNKNRNSQVNLKVRILVTRFPFPLARMKISDSNRLQEEYNRLVAGMRQAASQQDLIANPVLPRDILDGKEKPSSHVKETVRQF